MVIGQKIGYKRVSTLVQNTDRQLADLKLDRIFEDHASGRNAEDRPKLQELLEFVRAGDTVYIHSMDRLARNLKDLLQLTEKLISKGVEIRFVKENLQFLPEESANPMSKFLLMVLGAVAEFERALILERQREGIALAKARGAYKGRKPIEKTVIDEARRLIKAGHKVSFVAKKLKISRGSIYKYLN